MTEELKANIQEIFYSIQGEGPYVGIPMLFVRFSECNLQCDYCDTKESWEKVEYCTVESKELIRNDLTVNELLEIIRRYDLDYLTFTGGEPLLQAEFISQTVKGLKNISSDITVLLETNGLLPNKLRIVKESIDIFSVDIKLAQINDNKNSMAEFIEQVISKKCYFKIVFNESTADNLLKESLELIGDKTAEIILQPQSGVSNINPMEIIEKIRKMGFKNVRYIPQLHKLLEIK